MGFTTYNKRYYRKRIERCEATSKLSKADIYELRQLQKMLDDFADEGYFALRDGIEAEFCGATRLRALITRSGEAPFAQFCAPHAKDVYGCETQELSAFIDGLLAEAETSRAVSDNPFVGELAAFCESIPKIDGAAYVFLLRDAFLPYLYFKKCGHADIHPWLIGRRFANLVSPGNDIDDVVRAVFFDALEAGCDDFSSFAAFCRRGIAAALAPYPEIKEAIRGLLAEIKAERILVIESGVFGTFPMLLFALDERVDFYMFTTVPYLFGIYKNRLFTRAYEMNRLFETLNSQDRLFTLESYSHGCFRVRENVDPGVRQSALGEIRALTLPSRTCNT